MVVCVCAFAFGVSAEEPNPRVVGYQGIWFTLGQFGEYGDKYSGGLGTYTAKHRPVAIYAEAAQKTFFVFGGAKDGQRYLLNMIGYYDHATGEVPRPVIVHDKGGVDDPHDNASLAIDGDGYVWVFVSGRGRSRPGFIYKSGAPYSIDSFERVHESEFTYPQPIWSEGQGFLHLFTKYTKGRELYWSTSADGVTWSEDRKLAGMGGHYQVTEWRDGVVYTALNWHPGGSVDKRTNLYFVKSSDFGSSWQTAGGATVDTPMETVDSPALVHDFAAENRLVYVKDMQFDAAGRPAILVITSADFAAGAKGDPRVWTIAQWDGNAWIFREVARSDHNYDMGQLWIEGDRWRILAPTAPGPQPWGGGGEIELWESVNAGETWTKTRAITHDSERNHNYVRRPVNAHADFYAFWADGNPDTFSESHLYFTNRSGDTVWRLPYTMAGQSARPEVVRR